LETGRYKLLPGKHGMLLPHVIAEGPAEILNVIIPVLHPEKR